MPPCGQTPASERLFTHKTGHLWSSWGGVVGGGGVGGGVGGGDGVCGANLFFVSFIFGCQANYADNTTPGLSSLRRKKWWQRRRRQH